jgi:hypothetical protein
MKYNDLVARIQRERIRFLDIIDRIYAGDINAVNDLDPEVFNEHNRELFLWNAQAMEGKHRRNGKHYYVHPASAAYIVHLLVEPGDKDRDTAIGYTLTHDLLEVALDFDAEKFEQKVQTYGRKFRSELESSIILTSPDRLRSHRLTEKMATIYQVKETNNGVYSTSFVCCRRIVWDVAAEFN